MAILNDCSDIIHDFDFSCCEPIYSGLTNEDVDVLLMRLKNEGKLIPFEGYKSKLKLKYYLAE